MMRSLKINKMMNNSKRSSIMIKVVATLHVVNYASQVWIIKVKMVQFEINNDRHRLLLNPLWFRECLNITNSSSRLKPIKLSNPIPNLSSMYSKTFSHRFKKTTFLACKQNQAYRPSQIKSCLNKFAVLMRLKMVNSCNACSLRRKIAACNRKKQCQVAMQ